MKMVSTLTLTAVLVLFIGSSLAHIASSGDVLERIHATMSEHETRAAVYPVLSHTYHDAGGNTMTVQVAGDGERTGLLIIR